MPSQKLGRGDAEHGDGAGRTVEEAAAIERRNHAKRNADQHGKQQRPGDDRQRVRQTGKENVDRRLAHAQRCAEIALQRAADECDVLRKERAVEAQRLDQARAVLGSGILRQHQVDRIAGEPAEKEHDCRHQDEEHEALQQSTRDEAAHQRVSSERLHRLADRRLAHCRDHFFHGFWSG